MAGLLLADVPLKAELFVLESYDKAAEELAWPIHRTPFCLLVPSFSSGATWSFCRQTTWHPSVAG